MNVLFYTINSTVVWFRYLLQAIGEEYSWAVSSIDVLQMQQLNLEYCPAITGCPIIAYNYQDHQSYISSTRNATLSIIVPESTAIKSVWK